MARDQNYTIRYDVPIQTNDYLTQCNSKDVISISSDKWIGIKKLKEAVIKAFNLSNGLTAIISSISSYSGLENSKFWFHEGEEAEILRSGSQGWQKGKLKINVTLEFIPDETEAEKSPLDDIRQATINDIEQI